MLSKCSRGLRHALSFSTETREMEMVGRAIRRPTISIIRRPTISILKTSTESFLSSTEFNSERKEKEEEEEEEGKGHDIVIDRNALPSLFVQPELLPRAYWDQKGMIKRRGHLEQHWVVIYAFLDLSFADRLKMRSYCRLFHEVEKLLTLNKHGHEMLKPIPLSFWTSFPHPKYPTLNVLVDTLNRVYQDDPSKAPKIVFVMEGTFHIPGTYVTIEYPIMIIGAGQEKTTIHGGFNIEGTKEEKKRVDMQGMTMKGSRYSGLLNNPQSLDLMVIPCMSTLFPSSFVP